ncbi:nucleotidyl transferase AbiEii/AbiGii toxin family protein [Bacteroides sp. 519]|uniref:nucleotidyl transferase AbiEii/AbiGii toxin family protein n=1 Tax=Bacteroides sp. 519 TaxID=2302937 RepID=UPI0013D44A08|nr:nucleotidyl transferase AbiEii/AbiGii toxin family protein [Bacteroides sp. 519]NDV59355.1 hypothetical protein [Bacteroides sp. 519]
MLQTKTVHPTTLELLKKLQSIPLFKQLRLVGGTSLALQIGHRISVDLDLFGNLTADLQEIKQVLEKEQLQFMLLHNTPSIHVFTINGIKVDIVNYPYPWLEMPFVVDNLSLANMKDIAAMKLSAITNRGTKKDFIDLYFLLQHFTLQQMLDFYIARFDDSTLFPVIKSLSYFDDADSEPMPKMFIPTTWEEVKLKLTKVVANIAGL